jgi:Fur family ferric uptake transcriptional regulator
MSPLLGELVMEIRSGIERKLNQRSTEQRQLIKDILEHADGHLDADEIYGQARRHSPSISLSTVYRNLQRFKELGLVDEHQFGNRRCYEMTSQNKHHHLVCLGCGRVFEFRCPVTGRLKSRIIKEEGFRVTEAEVRLTGYCPECQRRLSLEMSKSEKVSGREEVR